MNKPQFISFLQSPVQLNSVDSQQLETVVQEFPYFQTARLLYLKALHNTQSIHFNNQLKLVAAYAGDRRVLYELVHLAQIKPKPQTVEPTVITPEVKVVELKPVVPILPTIQDKDVTQQPTTNPDSYRDQQPLDIEKINPLEKEILRSAINASINLEVDEVTKELNDEQLQQEIKLALEQKANRITEDKVEKQTVKNTDPETQTPKLETPNNFFDWISPSVSPENRNEDIQPEERKVIDKQKLNDLVDKFIVSQPRISKPKPEFFSPENMAQKSTSEDYVLVTETLAKIYEKQGNYLKAIKTYEALILKNPDKKPTFAARIAEIKEKINLNTK